MTLRYISRAVESALKTAARQFPVIVLTGPRQTGKSTLLSHLFPSFTHVTLDDPAQRALAKEDPRLFLETLGDRALIDEIQYAPELLPYIKMLVDQSRKGRRRVLLTGSQVFPLMAGLSESLAGRAAVFELLGFSWEELPVLPRVTAPACFERMFRGFYPVPALRQADPRVFYGSYVNTYLERDIRQIRSVEDLSLFQSFLQLLAGRVGSPLNLNEVARLCGVSHPTARKWLSLLETTRIVYLLRPYTKNITKRVVKSPKLYFTDTGLLAYLLRYPDATTLLHGPLAGAVFENLVVIDLLKRKQNLQGRYELAFYRDSNGNEMDIVLEGGDQKVLLEVKMSQTPRLEWAAAFEKLGDTFPGAKGRVLCLADKKMALSKNVECLPWFEFDPVTAGL